MGFSIGSQNAASIVNVDGNMTVEGGMRASASWEVYELRSLVGRLQDEVSGLALEPATRVEVNGLLSAAAAEANEPQPDKCRLADLLGTATQTLKDAGALAVAGSGFVHALRAAAAVLGPVGQALIALV